MLLFLSEVAVTLPTKSRQKEKHLILNLQERFMSFNAELIQTLLFLAAVF